MDIEKEARLLPCPFCGGEASGNGVIRYSSNPNCRWTDTGEEVLEAFYVSCIRCGAKIGGLAAGGYQTKGKAIDAWNRRAPYLPVAENAGEARDASTR